MSPDGAGNALQPSQRMRVAYALALVGGFLDAYTYLVRGGVFANAQTGNIVKLGIALANGARDTYLLFLLPIGSFVLGLLTALVVREHLTRRGLRLVRRTVLVVEALALVIVALIPAGEAWDALANCIVSFVAAMQYETFTTFRGDAIVTTMSTGNLKKLVDSLFAGAVCHDGEELARAARYLSVIATFSCGAFVGALTCDLLGRVATLPAVLALVAVVITITMLRGRNREAAPE